MNINDINDIDNIFKDTLNNFYMSLLEKSKPLEIEFEKVLNDNLFDLLIVDDDKDNIKKEIKEIV